VKKKQQSKRSGGGSWRDIQQTNRTSRSTSKAARLRRIKWLLRASFGLLLAGSLAAGIFGLVYLFTSRDEPEVTQSARIANTLRFETDGVLNESWFREHFGQMVYTDIREFEVSDLKRDLEGFGQVASASVTVELPSTLIVEVTERDPLLRVRVRREDGRPKTYLLSRDGHIFVGHGYPPDTLRRLPVVAGLKLKRTQGGFKPIEGISGVSHLLEHTRSEMPSVYRHWEVVDLRDWQATETGQGSLVRIRSAHIREIVFSTSDVEEQVSRLAAVLEHAERYQLGQPTFIDLSFRDEAVIRYD